MEETYSFLSTELISEIVARKLNCREFEVVNCKFDHFKETLGYLGEHGILNVFVRRYDNSHGDKPSTNIEELTFFVKVHPTNEGPSYFAQESGAFNKEVFINKTLFRKIKDYGINLLETCVPHCYFSERDTALIFDNLIEEGYRNVNKYGYFDYNTVLVVLESLVKLHATSMIYEEKWSEELKRPYRLNHDYESQFEETFYNDREGYVNLRGVDASVKGVLSEIDYFKFPETLQSGKNFKSVAKKCCYRIYELVKSSKKYRNVISHGDLWSSNLLFKFDEAGEPVSCKFVDFQIARYTPPSHDLMSLFYLTTSREFREMHMTKLVDKYYSLLETHLKLAGYDLNNILPHPDFLQSCEEQKLFAIVQTATYFQLVLANGATIQKLFEDRSVYEKAIFGDRSLFVLKNLDEDEVYNNKLKNTIHDLKDYCELL